MQRVSRCSATRERSRGRVHKAAFGLAQSAVAVGWRRCRRHSARCEAVENGRDAEEHNEIDVEPFAGGRDPCRTCGTCPDQHSCRSPERRRGLRQAEDKLGRSRPAGLLEQHVLHVDAAHAADDQAGAERAGSGLAGSPQHLYGGAGGGSRRVEGGQGILRQAAGRQEPVARLQHVLDGPGRGVCAC